MSVSNLTIAEDTSSKLPATVTGATKMSNCLVILIARIGGGNNLSEITTQVIITTLCDILRRRSFHTLYITGAQQQQPRLHDHHTTSSVGFNS